MPKAKPILECVPNFSEGRDPKIIEAIAASIRSVPEVLLLDIDPGFDANRTVYTFVGPPVAVVEAAYRAACLAVELIDMRQHKGAHPRLGALDVCPLIPISGITQAEAVAYADRLAQKLGDAGIPIYLYEWSATVVHRRTLPAIRRGEYEGLVQKMTNPRWQPDYGPTTNFAHCGATVLGARPFLIAYNINLDTEDKDTAHQIAQRLRTSGYRDGEGIRQSGALPAVRAIGWYMPEYHCAQVSTNIIDFEQNPVAEVYETCRTIAQQFRVEVTGSELIGMMPLAAALASGLYYSDSKKDTELIRAMVDNLGLDQLESFAPERRILEYRMAGLG